MRGLTTIDFTSYNAFTILNRNTALTFLNSNNANNHGKRHDQEKHNRKHIYLTAGNISNNRLYTRRETGNDTGKNNQRNTITNTIGTAPDGADNPGSGILKDIADLKKGDTITQIDASKITGVIDLDNLPKTVVERLTIVTNEEALKALTTEQVQNGDSVKVSESGLMYFVKDDTKLGSADTAMQAFEPYTVGIAGSVEWSGVLSKPTTLAGYGITDAVNANEKVTTAAGNAGKILVLNAEGKLDVDITGAADFTKLINAPSSTAAQIDQAVTNAEHTNRAMLDKIGEDTSDGTRLTYASEGYAKKAELDEVALGALKVVEAGALPEDAATGQMVLEKIGA